MVAPFLVEGWANKLQVVAAISNPRRYRTRYDLYLDFRKHMADSGVVLWTAEAAFGERSFAVTRADHPYDFQFRTTSEIWHKEDLINLAAQRLPHDWQYIAWIDADVHFIRTDWAEEAVHMLQHHPVIQLWTDAMDMTPSHEPLVRHKSFAWCFHHLKPDPDCDPYKPPRPGPHWIPWHPGFAWAMRRDAYEIVGGLIDHAICGAADNHMAKGIIGDAGYSMHPKIQGTYRRWVMQWQTRALAAFQKDMGYVHGLLTHAWHGQKRHRRYWDRWQILVKNAFDPELDLRRDRQGLWALTDRSPRLRDDMRRYFMERHEDSIDVNPSEGNM